MKTADQIRAVVPDMVSIVTSETEITGTTGGGARTSERLAYVPGLDGLRAVAVVAVLLYHADLTWFRGGYLGVDVFFVLSGYLITALLIAEWNKSRQINLAQFWLRRARRLLPALSLLLSGVLAFSVVFLPDEVARLRNDAIAASTYTTNWYLVLSQRSYFESVGRPSLFQHLWSLAIEEQFYLLWPLTFVFLMRFWKRWALGLVLAGAAASAAATWLVYDPDTDPSRLYYGTDTRAVALLIGVALAMAVASKHKQRPAIRLIWSILDLAGLAAVALIVWSFLALDETQELVYRGGMLTLEVATGVAILSLVSKGTRIMPLLLGGKLLQWVGKRSYGVYLWHWPVFMVSRPQLDVALEGVPLLILRLGLTFFLAGLSYRFVEMPVRNGALARVRSRLRAGRHGAFGGDRLRTMGVASLFLGLALLVAVPVVEAKPPAQPSFLMEESFNTVATGVTALPSESTEPTGAVSMVTDPTPTNMAATPTTPANANPPTGEMESDIPTPLLPPTTDPTQATAPPTATSYSAFSIAPTITIRKPTVPPMPTATVMAGRTELPSPTFTEALPTIPLPSITPVLPGELAPLGNVTAIGDSVMLGAARNLNELGNLSIDAAVSRQVSSAIDLLRSYHDSGRLGPIVVLHLGNNGTFTARQFDQIMAILADKKYVLFVNLKVPRNWEWPNNKVIMDGIARYPNARMIDWKAVAENRPSLFYKDGYHLRSEGAALYTSLIGDSLKQLIEK